MRHVSALLPIALAFAVAPAAAQQVLVVAPTPGPGVFSTSIAVAVNAAQSGDVVLVKAGSYAESVSIVSKSLVLTADAGVTAIVSGKISISGIAADQRVIVRGFDVSAGASTTALVLGPSPGAIWVEDSKFTGGFLPQANPISGKGCTIDGNANVVLTRCNFVGGQTTTPQPAPPAAGGIGLFARESNIHFADTKCTGGTGEVGLNSFSGAKGGAAAQIQGGFFFATGCTFQGGNGGNVIGPNSGGAGGPGLVLASDGTSFATFVAGGVGGTGGLTPGPNGPSVAGGTLNAIPGAARHFSVGTPAREGQTSAFKLVGIPNEFATVIFANAPSSILPLAPFGGSLLIDAATSVQLFFTGLGAPGSVTVPILMPQLPAGVLGVPVFPQALFFDLPTTYAVIGPASSLLILDASL